MIATKPHDPPPPPPAHLPTPLQVNYMRHASGQIYGLSRPVARYIAQVWGGGGRRAGGGWGANEGVRGESQRGCTRVSICFLVPRSHFPPIPTPHATQNEAILHRYANEDVGMGAWLIGLDIQYDNQRRMCCDTEWKCTGQVRAWLGGGCALVGGRLAGRF